MDTQPQSFVELLRAAQRLRGDARTRYLDENCPDAELRVEVERLTSVNGSPGELTRTFVGGAALGSAPAFVTGTRIAHYVIQKPLGSGGMGSVYLALDEKLHRSVAVKVIRAGQIDEISRKRLEREAQASSGLNHPNIVTVYEIGRDGDTDYIAMEHVAGDTLELLIRKKAFDTRTALRYATQIADALAAAHDAHIVHRDLKPGNLMVTERGQIKVLDFGLAKHTAESGEDGEKQESALTAVGRVVGTFCYVSPEQAEGKLVDARSDIFSFGAVVYEMLTGRRAFDENSTVATLAAILHKQPPLDKIPQPVPPALTRLIARCLAKKVADRWQHMSDVRVLLEDVAREMDSPFPATAAPRRWTAGWKTIAAASVVCATLAALAVRQFWPPPPAASGPEPILRMITADAGLSAYPALSKDGNLLAFASDRSNEGNLDIWVQQVGGGEPIRLTRGTADEKEPAFSPDGTRIAFRSEQEGGGIYTVSALGGEPVPLAAGGRNPRYSPDGKSVAYWTGGEGIYVPGSSRAYVIDSGGGQPRRVHPEMTSATYPIWSPSGNELLVLGKKDAAGPPLVGLDWWVLPVGNGSPKATGALESIREQKLGLGGILPQAVRPTGLDWIEDNGSQVLFSAALGDVTNLWEMGLTRDHRATGRVRRLTSGPGRHPKAASAQAGNLRRIAFTDEKLNFDVWTIPVDADRGVTTGDMRRLTTDATTEWSPSVSADGRKLAYFSRLTSSWAVRIRDVESGTERTLISSPRTVLATRISGNGSLVFYSDNDYKIYSIPSAGGMVAELCKGCGTVMGASHDGGEITYEPLQFEDLLLLDTESRRTMKVTPREDEGALLSSGQISKDGRWVAFHSLHNAVSTARVFVAPIDRTRTVPPSEWVPITEGKSLERDPWWAPGGGLIYFLSERDGFRCVWARRVDPATKRPFGDIFNVRHFHTARQSLRGFGSRGYLTGLSVGKDRMVFSLGELTGNIWLQEETRAR